jgi:L-cystine uptake protein TcyP (sodium:dicarboxylate symporter family)
MVMASIRTGPDDGPIREAERFLQATKGEDPAMRTAMVRALAGNSTADTLWRWVVVGLLLLSSLALAGLLFLVGDGNSSTEPELALTAFVGLLGGLLGLLIGAPWRQPAA